MPETLTISTVPEPGARARRPSGWRRLAIGGALAAVVAGTLSTASPAGADGTCLNAAVRAQTGSIGLPDCRGYEMVTPPYKEGFPANPSGGIGFGDDGIFSYLSTGSFAGNPRGTSSNSYHATRSATGWATTALFPPDVIYDTGGGGVIAESVDLRRAVVVMRRRAVAGDPLGFWLRGPDGGFTRIGDAEDVSGPRFFNGASADLSHLVFNHGPQGGSVTALYEYVGTGNGTSARAVSVNNDGQPTPVDSCLDSISDDGRVIAFTSGCGGGSRVWARVAGSASVAVSGSECTRSVGDPGGACNSPSAAVYGGGAADGSRLFFTTSQQLVNGDTNTGNDLYACDIPAGVPAPVGSGNPCASLTEVSGSASDAQVENVAAISEDGSRAYFVAQGVLADNLGIGGVSASAGANNLYVWERDGDHPAGQTRFVTGLDANDLGRAQMTPDGRYLLFTSANPLVITGPAADTDGGAVDAYRYDAVTNAIARVSTSVTGSGGNGPGADVSIGGSAMTADGSMVVFDSAEALSADDTDGVNDVYAWHDDGRVSLISAGGGSSLGITASGSDIFFSTDARVLGVDGDFNTDIYDARIDGGFAPAQPAPCSGDGCQGQHSQSPSLPEPPATPPNGPSAIQTPSAFSVRAVSVAQRKALAATGRVSLVVTANAPGTINATATATITGRSTTVATGQQTLTAPGRATVTLTLSKKARGQLAARGKLSVKVAVSHSKVALNRVITLRLVHAKAKRSAAHGVAVGGRS